MAIHNIISHCFAEHSVFSLKSPAATWLVNYNLPCWQSRQSAGTNIGCKFRYTGLVQTAIQKGWEWCLWIQDERHSPPNWCRTPDKQSLRDLASNKHLINSRQRFSIQNHVEIDRLKLVRTSLKLGSEFHSLVHGGHIWDKSKECHQKLQCAGGIRIHLSQIKGNVSHYRPLMTLQHNYRPSLSWCASF